MRDDNGTPNDPTDDRLVHTPLANFIGTDTFTYEVSNNFDVATATVTVTINPSTNNLLQAINDVATVVEDNPSNISVLVNDSILAGTPFILSLATLPVNGIASINNNGTPENPSDDFITYTPTVNFNGADLLTYQISDGINLATATATINVTPVDDAPFVLNPIANITAAEDALSTSIDLATVFSDVDNSLISITKSLLANTNSALVNATIASNILTINYQPNQSGTANITIQGGSGGQTVNTTFNVTLTSVNDAPTIAIPIPDQTTTEGQSFSFTFTADTFNDIDINDSLTYTAALANGSSLPGWLTFDAANRAFNGTPTNVDIGTLDLKVIAIDIQGATAEDSFNLQVINPAIQPIPIQGGAGNETLTGTAGNDIILGLGGRDIIIGGAGDDTIIGGFGSDLLTGGLGKDYFVYNSIDDRSDRITDFQVGEDVLDLRNLFAGIGYQGNDPVADGYLQIVSSGSTSSIRIDIDGTFGSSAFKTLVTLDNVLPTSLTPNNYLFS